MRHDDQVKVALSLKKDLVLNSGWEIKCEVEEIRDFIVKALTLGMEIPIDEALRDMLSSYDYGFSLTEPVYQIVDGRYQPKGLKTRPPHSFRFEIDAKGQLLEIKQHTSREDKSFSPNIFIHHVYQPEFGNPYGKSDLRAAHPAWTGKKFIFRMMATYLERFANPTVVGKYDKNMDTNEINRFHSMLRSMQNSTTLTIPEEAMVDIIQTNRDSTDAYIKAINLCNMMMARSILVPDLLGIGGGETEGGSFALGNTHYKLFLKMLDKDKTVLQRLITLRLVQPLVKVNFGEYDCAFEFRPFSEENELEFQRIWIEAVKGRIFEPNPEEINHLRAQLRYPQGPVNLTQPQIPAGPFGESNRDGTRRAERPANGDQGDKPKLASKTLDYRLRREVTAYEMKVDFAQVAETLEIHEHRVTPKLKTAGSQIYRDWIEQVRDSGLIRRFQPEKMNDLKPRFLKDMNVVVKRFFKDLYADASQEAAHELLNRKLTLKFEHEPMLPEEFLTYLEAESFKIVGDYATEVTKRMRNILSRGIRDGLAESELVKLLREEAGDISEHWLSTVIRTKTTEVYNQARKIYWETDEIAKEIVKAYEFSAILDERTSEVCERLDGKIFEISEYTDKVTPPLHFNCRSLLVPVTKFEPYTPDAPVDIDSLKDIGGGLIAG